MSNVTVNIGTYCNVTASYDGITLSVTAEVLPAVIQQQTDWNETNTDAASYLKNKPTNDDTVTETSQNAVKSSGIWTWVTGLFTTHTTEADAHPASAISVGNTSLGILAVETFSEAYEIVANDTNKIKRCTSATDLNVTIPLNLTLPLPVAIEQAGNGVVTVVGAAGVTVNGDPKTAGQYKYIVVQQVAANTYTIIGGTS